MRADLCLLAALASACGDNTTDVDPIIPECFVGDPDLPPEIELVLRTVDGELAPLEDGGTVPLILPPQGGKVFLVGVRARNVDGCSVRISASIRDECSGRIVGRDGRPIFLVEGPDGWAVPRQPRELSDYANVPACPNFASERDLDGEPYLLEVSIVDRAGRSASAMATVTPVCAEERVAAQCACECDADYILGEPCTVMKEPRLPPGTCPDEANAWPGVSRW